MARFTDMVRICFLYFLAIAALVLSVAASVKVQTTYSKFSKVMSRSGLTAEHLKALKILKTQKMLDDDELKGSKKVLTAAAMTYVAAMLSSLIQLLRLISSARRNK